MEHKVTKIVTEAKVEINLSYPELREIVKVFDQLNNYSRGLSPLAHTLSDDFNTMLRKVEGDERLFLSLTH